MATFLFTVAYCEDIQMQMERAVVLGLAVVSNGTEWTQWTHTPRTDNDNYE